MRVTIAHVLFFAASYACVGIFVRLALDDGASLTATLVARTGGSTLLLWLALVAMGAPWRMPPTERYRALAIGLVLALSNYCIMSAFARIPISIAILTLYTFPFWTALASAALGRERLTGRMVTALLLAFGGLAITVQARIAEYDIVGIALAATSAVTITIVMILQTYAFKGGDARARTLHMLFTASVVMILIAIVQGVQLPQSLIGWGSLVGSPLAYVIGITGMFVAAAAIGAARTAFFMNFEPIAATILAWIVLDQRLSPVQVVGAAIVIAALLIARRRT
jgi:drug/metabolite transporter (DMT)-like permease